VPTVEYKLRDGFNVRGNITAVAERIEWLKKKHADKKNPDGYTTPQEVLEDARNPESPLHGHFTWKESEAARKWNIEEARHLIRCYEVHFVKADRKPIVVSPANVVIRNQPTRSNYVSASYAMSDDTHRKDVIDDALRRISGAQLRLSGLQGLSPQIIAKISELIELIELERDKKEREEIEARMKEAQATKKATPPGKTKKPGDQPRPPEPSPP
jgi:hypothetical protein